MMKEQNGLFSKVYIGMNDKNGTPIHEGDKVRFYYKGEFVVCTIVYEPKVAAFLLKWPDGYVNHYFLNGSTYEVVKE